MKNKNMGNIIVDEGGEMGHFQSRDQSREICFES